MKRVKVFEDKQKVQNIEQVVNAGVQKVQQLVNAFNETGFRPVSEDEMPKLLADPMKLYKERTDEMELPPNVIREKYLSMVNLPSTDNLKKAWEEFKPHDLVRSPELVRMIAGKVLVNEEKLEALTNRYRIYVNEGSKEHKAAKQYFAFIETLNGIAASKQNLLSDTSGRNVLLDLVHVTREDGLNKAVPTMEKLRNFINS